jgi:hypothetical protein
MTKPLHKSQHAKNLGNTRIAYKPRPTCTRARTHTRDTRSQEKHRWQLVTQLLTNHNTQRGQNTNTNHTQPHNGIQTNVCHCVFVLVFWPLCMLWFVSSCVTNCHLCFFWLLVSRCVCVHARACGTRFVCNYCVS